MCVALAVFLFFTVFPLPARAGEIPGRVCPLTSHVYKVQPVRDHLPGRVDEPVILSFMLDPAEPPPGFFLSVNLRPVRQPETLPDKASAPQILTGFPDTRFVFSAPGVYTYAVIVSLIAKSSCGGVKADTIFNGQVRIEIRTNNHL
ncbi:MAG: hypothetical protein V6Z89_02215 [Desulfobacter sp.]